MSVSSRSCRIDWTPSGEAGSGRPLACGQTCLCECGSIAGRSGRGVTARRGSMRFACRTNTAACPDGTIGRWKRGMAEPTAEGRLDRRPILIARNTETSLRRLSVAPAQGSGITLGRYVRCLAWRAAFVLRGQGYHVVLRVFDAGNVSRMRRNAVGRDIACARPDTAPPHHRESNRHSAAPTMYRCSATTDAGNKRPQRHRLHPEVRFADPGCPRSPARNRERMAVNARCNSREPAHTQRPIRQVLQRRGIQWPHQQPPIAI